MLESSLSSLVEKNIKGSVLSIKHLPFQKPLKQIKFLISGLEMSKGLNFTELETELYDLVKEEDLYWLQNDAKFRAVQQNVTYKQFDSLVKVK